MAHVARTVTQNTVQSISIPIFLCPRLSLSATWRLRLRNNWTPLRKQWYQTAAVTNPTIQSPQASTALLHLPLQCPGCGAYAQTANPELAGFYNTSRKSVKDFLARRKKHGSVEGTSEDDVFGQVLGNASQEVLANPGIQEHSSLAQASELEAEIATPICHRCHHLLHHRDGLPIAHPNLRSIQEIISESPYKYNHVYHVLDAADFPLSLIPRLQQYLSLSPQRSLNRRASKSKYYHGRKAELSFIITRSDLLAPQKEQVDSLMPYLIQVLRDALGYSGKDVRLGNVRCVSSKRGWWTKEVKEDIWERGGGGWMVGKVNVGKSNLFECIFPKGRTEEVNFQAIRRAATRKTDVGSEISTCRHPEIGLPEAESLTRDDPQHSRMGNMVGFSLLPPAPQEMRYPVLPVVSSLPGTTASPIRLPFGSGKGELIDLPGLSREGLEDHVSDEHKQTLVMEHRVTPERLSIKPGQSLLLGGIVRITPTTPNTILLAYPFVPLSAHVTSTEKAVALQTQNTNTEIPIISRPGVGELISSAGSFQLKWDVTKQRAGPLTAPAAVGLKTATLPFVVYSADILIEGCGWVELAVQVRKRNIEKLAGSDPSIANESCFPEVKVFSPNGRHIGYRRPMNAWLLGGEKSVPGRKRIAKRRGSMKGQKKNMKKLKAARNVTLSAV